MARTMRNKSERRKVKLRKREQQQSKQLSKQENNTLVYERKRQLELDTQLFGFWKLPLDGDDEMDVWRRCVWYGDWRIDTPPAGNRSFHVDFILKHDDKDIVFYYQTEPCLFSQLTDIIDMFVNDIETQHADIDFNLRQSYAKVRT